MEPFLSDENSFLADQLKNVNQTISDDFDLSEEFGTFFEDAVRLLNVEIDEYFLSDTKNLSNPVDIAIRKFEDF